ncbi:MAG: glycosyltransferase family 2 protein, partial [Acidimicrobiaceae bacterium]|nr:glycosyltransferase family 2 protein [Acidimicrobiaceae bacterium]
LLNRAALEDVGVLDPTFFCYYEDTDLSWRMRLHGWQVVYEPAAVVEHLHAGTSVEWSPFFTFHVDRNRLFMILKNAPAGFVVSRFLGLGLMSLRTVARALLRPLRPRPAATASPAPGVSPLARAFAHAGVMRSFLANLPQMLRKRHQIRGTSLVPDQEIMPWLHSRRLWESRSV